MGARRVHFAWSSPNAYQEIRALDSEWPYDRPMPRSEEPAQELRQRVDLIIVSTAGKLNDLDEEIVQPICVPGHKHMTGLDLRGLSVHPGQLVAQRFESDCLR